MDFNNANTVRNTAPEQASALRALRAQGVDPNSPQGQAALARVNSTRAQAFDNNQANNIAASNQLTLGKSGALNQLGQEGLANDQTLGQSWLNNDNGLSIARSNAGNNEAIRSTNADNNYDQTGSQEAMANENQNLGQMNNWYANQRGDINQNSTNKRNDIMTNYSLNDKAYQQGVNGQNTNTQNKMAALGGLTTQQQIAGNNALAWNAQGNQANEAAWKQYAGDYGLQQPNAGWGTKMLAGAAGAGLKATGWMQ
jgi:hypothetical protein